MKLEELRQRYSKPQEAPPPAVVDPTTEPRDTRGWVVKIPVEWMRPQVKDRLLQLATNMGWVDGSKVILFTSKGYRKRLGGAQPADVFYLRPPDGVRHDIILLSYDAENNTYLIPWEPSTGMVLLDDQA